FSFHSTLKEMLDGVLNASRASRSRTEKATSNGINRSQSIKVFSKARWCRTDRFDPGSVYGKAIGIAYAFHSWLVELTPLVEAVGFDSSPFGFAKAALSAPSRSGWRNTYPSC